MESPTSSQPPSTIDETGDEQNFLGQGDDQDLTAKRVPGIKRTASSLPVDHSGTTVYVKGWIHPQTDYPTIILLHDLADHIGLYRRAALDLVEEGFSVYGFDLRGHGRSGRRLGHAPSFDVLVKDLLQVVAWVRHKRQGQKPILIGQGIGANVAMDFLHQYSKMVRAAVFCAPCIELKRKISMPTQWMLKSLAELTPTARIPYRLSPRFTRQLQSTSAQSAAEVNKQSPFPRLTAAFTWELMLAVRRSQQFHLSFPGNILFICPTEDPVCSYSMLRKQIAVHDRNNVELLELEGAGHRPLVEPKSQRMRTVLAIREWLKEKDLLSPEQPAVTSDSPAQNGDGPQPVSEHAQPITDGEPISIDESEHRTDPS